LVEKKKLWSVREFELRALSTDADDPALQGRNAIGAAISLIKEQQLIIDDMLGSGHYHGTYNASEFHK
jgi:hypothetical protein